MKKLLSMAALGVILLSSSCTRGVEYLGPEPPTTTDPNNESGNQGNKATQEEINANVKKVFGTSFSSDQDWSSTTKYTVSVVADAPMDDIVKVQILTEAPYFNEDARVLNEAPASKGKTVTLNFDCPSVYQELVAACVDSKGVYYITGFKAGDSQVNFQKAAQTRTRAAYDLPELPATTGLKIKYKNSHLSFNAIRAQKAGQDGEAATLDPWKNSNWDNERLWMLSNEGGNSTWKVEKQTIYRKVSITEKEKEVLETVLAPLGGKNAHDATHKQVNLNTIRNSSVYQLTQNYLVADGKAPITVSPVQIQTTDHVYDNLYYYYFNPNELKGKSKDEQITFLKNLPKFKCVDCKLVKSASGTANGNGDFFKVHECVLPYFGDVKSSTTTDVTVQSFTIPEGYYVGFMLRKSKSNYLDSYTKDNDIYKNGTNYSKKSYEGSEEGEVYADGRLNEQINQFPTFSQAVDKGMKKDDPRAAIFGANQRAYMMFEEGCDVNFVDMIFEINGGLFAVDAAQEINNNVYTFCFEDRDLGDYDMNDVVIKAERLNMSQVKYTVVACGAWDELYLRNINGQTLNTNTEVHHLFGVNDLKIRINTEEKKYEPVSEIITVDPSFSFTDLSKQVYIYNKTKGYDVKMAQQGEDPHAIMVPCDFAYPVENHCIKGAYKQFNNWGQNPVNSTDWYLYPESNEVLNAFVR